MRRWGERAGQDAAHTRECAEYLALCHHDALHAGDDGSFDDDGSWLENALGRQVPLDAAIDAQQYEVVAARHRCWSKQFA
jgi:hypothetical protein